MQIQLMAEDDLEEIIGIDETAFNRMEPRKISNLKALLISDQDGCFVLVDENKIIGYNYSKSMGSEGYIGPLGVLPSYQNRGLGKLLINKSVDYLKERCKVIGLEVLPEKGNVIGLYHKMGFISGFPSYLFHLPKGQNLDLRSSNKFQIENVVDTTNSQFKSITDSLEGWTYKTNDGLSFTNDLEITRDLKGIVFVAYKDDYPAGFLAYSETLVPTLWGAVDGDIEISDEKLVMKDLLNRFNEMNGFEEVVLQINSRHNILIETILEIGFKVHRTVNRMYLMGYEGEHLKHNKSFIMKPWRG